MANPSECCVKVFCRVRPLNEMEKKNGSSSITKFQTKDTLVVSGKPYSFDRVFEPISTQKLVYEEAAHHIVKDVLSGYNGTIFAYGQTSSGKTHTMEGEIDDNEKMGIIPRIIHDIFNHIYNMNVETDAENVIDDVAMQIKISYFEIYNERIRDLLDPTNMNLPIHEDRNRVPYVKGVTEKFVSNPEEVFKVISDGKENRKVAVTNMNEHSSRSHSVFQIQVEQENKTKQKKLTGKLYLVDLAGSEKVSKTGAEGMVLEEAKNINKSLSALGNVIAALADLTKGHIPYRDSKLTRILQESLGGNSRTTIVVCCSPASYNEGETKSTLLFGQRAKTIKNVVVVNEELTAEEWKRRYERERDKAMRLRSILLSMENEVKRWRTGERVPNSDWSSTSETYSTQMTDSVMTPSMSESMFTSPRNETLFSSQLGPVADDERRKYEEERAKLYQQLDEKDDEIQVQSQLAERYRLELMEKDEGTRQYQVDYDTSMAEMSRLQEQLAKSKEETEELFSAIQEIHVNFEQKKTENAQLIAENEKMTNDINKKNLEAVVLTSKLDEMREVCTEQKKRVCDSVQSMLKELSELDGTNVLPEKFISEINDVEKVNDEELLTHARLFISQLTADFKSNQKKLQQLESGSDDIEKRLETATKELADSQLQSKQLESRNKALQDNVDSYEKQKRSLEDDLDQLNAKLAKISKTGNGPANEEAEKQHQKLIAQLRDQIAQKNGEIKKLTEQIQEVQLAKDKLQQDYDRAKNDENEKEKRLKNLSALSDKKEQAKQDLKGLEETVQKELQSLHNFRKLFVQDLSQRMKKVPTGQENEDEYLSGPIQKQKIIFLENNLEQLTSVHKQLVRDNAELRCELPKLEKRYRAAMERIKNLETALREAKENAMKDRKKYQYEVERIKEAVRQRQLARRGVQIVKPIRPGQQPSTMGIKSTNVY